MSIRPRAYVVCISSCSILMFTRTIDNENDANKKHEKLNERQHEIFYISIISNINIWIYLKFYLRLTNIT